MALLPVAGADAIQVGDSVPLACPDCGTVVHVTAECALVPWACPCGSEPVTSLPTGPDGGLGG